MKVQIVVGSTRPGRVSDKVAAWVANDAGKLDGVEAEVVDLADYPLPFFDEAVPPQYNPNRKANEIAQGWLNKLAEADAYVLVTPEYNRSTSGVLKNALDYVDFQMKNKPVAIVAHGSTGGAQAAASLRGVLSGLKAFAAPTVTYMSDRAGEVINEDGELAEKVKSNPYGPQASLDATLGELKWAGDALAAAR